MNLIKKLGLNFRSIFIWTSLANYYFHSKFELILYVIINIGYFGFFLKKKGSQILGSFQIICFSPRKLIVLSRNYFLSHRIPFLFLLLHHVKRDIYIMMEKMLKIGIYYNRSKAVNIILVSLVWMWWTDVVDDKRQAQ